MFWADSSLKTTVYVIRAHEINYQCYFFGRDIAINPMFSSLCAQSTNQPNITLGAVQLLSPYFRSYTPNSQINLISPWAQSSHYPHVFVPMRPIHTKIRRRKRGAMIYTPGHARILYSVGFLAAAPCRC